MDGYIVQGGMAMARGSLVRIEDGKGMLVYVWDGELWLTQPGDSRDHFLRRGQWFRLDRHGAALAYALRHASVTLTAPVPSHYARRITVALPGMSAPRIIYERAQEPAGWLEAARQRLARGWANSYAPLSRPTTAAL